MLVFEIPSNYFMMKYGALRWVGRSLITEGIASTATCLASGSLIVGSFEAGVVPWVLLYLTYWVPTSRRGRATSVLKIAQPIAINFGSLLSGLIMSSSSGYVGLSGGQWLFLIESLPTVVLGTTVLFYLPNRPASADWLTRDEASALQAHIDAEPVDLQIGKR